MRAVNPLSLRQLSATLIMTMPLFLLSALPLAQAEPKLRFQIDQRGDMVLFGNTVGYDCRQDIAPPNPAIPVPVVGDVDRTACGDFISDTSADVWWRADDPVMGRARASKDISPQAARSTAMLQLPAGAQVTYARLYVSASYDELAPLTGMVTFERPGSFAQILAALPSDVERNIVGGSTYQASFDITSILQKYGPGAYRVTGIPGSVATNANSDINYAAWGVIVLYRRDADPIRNLAIFDGLTGLGGGQQADISISGFRAPASGSIDAKLGIIGYEGDHDLKEDSLIFNGQKLSDGTAGSEDNFFNSTRTNKGQPVSIPGDLPQMSGLPGSMIGLDLDVVDVSNLVKLGDTSAAVTVQSRLSDVLRLGALATSIANSKPIIETTLSAQPSGQARPGDPIEFTSTTRNIGNDIGTDVTIKHPLLPALDYIPGTCEIVSGPNAGKKTDAAFDDQCDVIDILDPQTMKPTKLVVVRIGMGANATKGGSLSPSDTPVVVRFRARVKDDAPPGMVPNRNTTTTTPPGVLTPIGFPSCSPTLPCAPTVITIPPCASAIDCGITKPYCDTTGTGGALNKGQCTDRCKVDPDCKGSADGNVCDTATGKCVQCTPAQTGACLADGVGKLCLSGGRCGCNSNADCGGRTCAMNRCPPADSDLMVEVTQTPDPVAEGNPVQYEVDVTNKGPARDPGPIHVNFEIPQDSGGYVDSIVPGPDWRCTVLGRKVACTRYSPLDPNERTPAVTVTVKPYDPANLGDPNNPQNPMRKDTPSVQIHVTASSDGATDSHPDDNSAYRLTLFGDGAYRIAGGGTSCTVSNEHSQSTVWSLGAAALVLLLGLARSRRPRTNR